MHEGEANGDEIQVINTGIKPMEANVDEVQVSKTGTEPMEANVDEVLVDNMGEESIDPIVPNHVQEQQRPDGNKKTQS